MGRVDFDRKLPPLETEVRNFSGFPEGKSRQQVIVEELRSVGKNLKSDKARPFYSMRQVAKFFNAPLATISMVYRVLEREGMINRIRSSHTMLVGKTAAAREAVRGVVGLPVWLRSMIILPYTRTLVMDLEERLRRAGYLADIIFHHTKDEETMPTFAMRLLRHRLDAIVLHTPNSRTKQNILSWRERGVRVIILQRTEVPTEAPAVVYLLDFLPAYQKMAARWHETGVRNVWLWSPMEAFCYKGEVDSFRLILEQRGIGVKMINDEPHQLLKKIGRRKKKKDTAVAFIESANCERICNCEPQTIAGISQVARLAFCAGRVRVPHFQLRGIRVDIVEPDPTEIATRLTQDICRLSVLPDGIRHTFLAHYHDQEMLLEDSLAEI